VGSSQADFSGGEGVRRVPVGGDEIDSNGIRQRADEEDQGNDHSQGGAVSIGRDTSQRRHDGAAGDTRDNPARAPLGVLAQAAHAQGDDGGEADGLEEQDHVEQRHARPAPLRDAGADEDDTEGQEDEEDPAGADEVHQEGAEEAANGEGALRSG